MTRASVPKRKKRSPKPKSASRKPPSDRRAVIPALSGAQIRCITGRLSVTSTAGTEILKKGDAVAVLVEALERKSEVVAEAARVATPAGGLNARSVVRVEVKAVERSEFEWDASGWIRNAATYGQPFLVARSRRGAPATVASPERISLAAGERWEAFGLGLAVSPQLRNVHALFGGERL